MAHKVTDFKVGDLVRVRDWDDMAKEFIEEGSYILLPGFCAFHTDMKPFCGQSFVIQKVECINCIWTIKCHNFDGWTITPEMIEPVNRETKERK